MAFVELRGIKKHFDTVKAVDGVDLEIKDGELYFRTTNNETHKPLAEIGRIEMIGEPVGFNQPAGRIGHPRFPPYAARLKGWRTCRFL